MTLEVALCLVFEGFECMLCACACACLGVCIAPLPARYVRTAPVPAPPYAAPTPVVRRYCSSSLHTPPNTQLTSREQALS